ncbi:hypothetical protein L195_g035373 [Trifolium pratense]|uniref:Secreted protein n=1 Tax=Trifolium pratense TaxID=57577 RepID=A0A2K3LLI3_TRIPR|nr:hypothetical protein L195_g035373 [Trifolium pratense]
MTFFCCSWFAGVFLFAGVYGVPTFAGGFEGARDGSGSVVVVTVLRWDGGGYVRSVKGGVAAAATVMSRGVARVWW